jgi:hypothetical protein
MSTGSTLFLRIVIFLIGLVIAGLCTFLIPYAIITNEMGLYFPILVGMYIPAVPFFFALWQGWKLLDYIDNGTAFSEVSVTSIRYIKYCAALVSAFYALALPYIFYVAEKDDAPGVVVMGIVFAFAPLVVAVFAAVLQRLLQTAIDIKSENDLTV